MRGGSRVAGERGAGMLDQNIEDEGIAWVTEMLSDQFDGYIPAAFCELLFMLERQIREESGDLAMDHATMTDRLMEMFEADPEVPTETGAVSPNLVFETLHWEDQFRSMAGEFRNLRPPTGAR